MTTRQRQAGKMTVSVAALGVLVTILIWLTNNALSMESRVTKCEVSHEAYSQMVSECLKEIKRDIRDVKSDIRTLLIRTEALEHDRVAKDGD